MKKRSTMAFVSFKNVAYSVAKRHQRLICAILQGKFFSYDDLECGPCKLNAAFIHLFIYNFNVGVTSTSSVCLKDDTLRDVCSSIPDVDLESCISRYAKIHRGIMLCT